MTDTQTAQGADLAAWLLEQIAEDERDARAAGGGPWHRDANSFLRHLLDSSGDVVVYDEGAPSDEEFAHIVRHDPARVLAECDAKRRIAERYIYLCEQGDAGDARWVLRILALPYADRPGYQPEWAPVG